jgi:hypothetical protein
MVYRNDTLLVLYSLAVSAKISGTRACAAWSLVHAVEEIAETIGDIQGCLQILGGGARLLELTARSAVHW